MKAEISVKKPGLYTSVQDNGRWGYLSYGVPVSGAMDSYCARLANMLLGNPPEAAVLEITLQGPVLNFSSSTNIVITGACLSPSLNDHPVDNNKVYCIRAGDTLRFGKRVSGCRAYLAIPGGIQTPEILKSRSWFMPVTGVSRLERGMKLPYIASSEVFRKTYSGIKHPFYPEQDHLAALPGPEFEMLNKQQRKQIVDQVFHLGSRSNRMGIELGPKIPNHLDSILTGPVMAGSVQLTPDGNLVVLMRDCQTTGGYPRVLQLTEQAINSLSQKNVGEEIRITLT